MNIEPLILLGVLAFSLFGYWSGQRRALCLMESEKEAPNVLPRHCGLFVALCVFTPAILSLLAWFFLAQSVLDGRALRFLSVDDPVLASLRAESFLRAVRACAAGDLPSSEVDTLVVEAAHFYASDLWVSQTIFVAFMTVLCCLCLGFALRAVKPSMRARKKIEALVLGGLVCSSAVAVITTLGIILSLFSETWRFFQIVPIQEFLFGLHWSPQSDDSGAFGAVALFAGTALITLITMCVAVPVGLMSAIYLADYASDWFRAIVKPILEILAGVPTVVYGFFAALILAPSLREWGMLLGYDVASESALAAGVAMGIMIIPFISSLSDDVLCAVPQALRDGSSALGATKSETVIRVVLPAAMPGIISALLLAVSRAIGETMIVVMAAGLAARLTMNPLEAVTTVTVQIVSVLSGDQAFDNPRTLSAFALSFVLFFVTLVLNLVAMRMVRRYRRRYD